MTKVYQQSEICGVWGGVAVASNQRMRAALYEVIHIIKVLSESAYCKVVNMPHRHTLNYRQLAG